MSDYTLTTANVREQWIANCGEGDLDCPSCTAAFDRWLSAHDKEVLEAIVNILNRNYGHAGPFIITTEELNAAIRGEETK